MKPIREILIQEWMPGDYTIKCDGRTHDLHSRRELRQWLNGELGDLPLSPDEEKMFEEMEEIIHSLKEDLAEARIGD